MKYYVVLEIDDPRVQSSCGTWSYGWGRVLEAAAKNGALQVVKNGEAKIKGLRVYDDAGNSKEITS